MNSDRALRWQQESANRRTWANKTNQTAATSTTSATRARNVAITIGPDMASAPGAAQELIAAADKVGAGLTSWINNMLDTSSPLELGIVGGAVGALVGPAVLSAVGPIGSALTLGGPLAELGMLEESIGNIFQATRWGSGIIAGGANLLEKAGLFNRRWNVLDDSVVAEGTGIFKEGIYHLDPKTIRFTQPNVSPNFANGGSVNELIRDLRAGNISAYDLPPIQVVQKDGKLFSIDNRRLLAFNAADVEKIPVEIVSISNPKIALKLVDRFDPIGGQGNFAIVVNSANRNASLDLLYEHNIIKGIHRGY